MHKALHRAIAASPDYVQATIKAVYRISYQLPDRNCAVFCRLQHWLTQNAKCTLGGGQYTSWAPKGHEALQVYGMVWNTDWEALEQMRTQCYVGADSVCAAPQ